MALDWSLLGQGPQFGSVLASYKQGQTARKERDTQSALELYAQDPKAGVGALTKIDPILGMKLRDDLLKQETTAARKGVIQTFATDPAKARDQALALGDSEAVDAWSKLDKASRERAHEVAGAVGDVAFGALQVAQGDTPEALEARKASLAPQEENLLSIGLPEAKVKELVANPTMANLQAAIAGSRETMKLKIDKDEKDRAFAATDADRRADNERADKQFAETVRGNRVQEGQGAARIAIARQAEGRAGGEARLKLTEGQAKDGFSAKRLEGAAGVLGALEGRDKFDPTLTGVGALAAGTPLAMAGVGDVSRQYNAAKKEWSDSLIRLTTGAAATKDELAAADQTYFPQYGDSKTVVAQKAASRARVERDATFRAGPGATPTPGGAAGWKVLSVD